MGVAVRAEEDTRLPAMTARAGSAMEEAAMEAILLVGN
jgi:hypothetical protein